jgi:diacylglycerol kinase family enzyme
MAHPKFAFLINPGSGSVSNTRITALHESIKQHKIDGEVILAGANIEEQTIRLRDAGYQAVIAAGGDGTLRAVAAALVGTKTAFGVLPWGTFNHFAKDLEVPDSIDLIFTALSSGRTRQIDTGEVNGELFLNNSSIGLYPRFVAEREKLQAKIGKFPAAALVALKLFIQYRTHKIKLTIDGETVLLRTPLVFIGNNHYQIDRLGLVARPNLTGGQLCVYTLKSTKRADMIRLAWRLLLGNAHSMELFEQYNPTELTVDLSKNRSILVALDGEVERMDLPLEILVRARHLKLIDTQPKS